MPEGHSIHRLAIQFNDLFAGQSLATSSPQGRFAEGAGLLDGMVLEEAFAHGKHLFARFERGLHLNVHLGIYGAWTFGGDETFAAASSIGAPRTIGERERGSAHTTVDLAGGLLPDPRPSVRLRVVGEHGWADLTGPTVCRVLNDSEVAGVRAALGPDPLNHDADPRRFYDAASRTRRPIGVVLMDQKVISGVGNIFRAESLFRQGIDPHRPAASLTAEQLQGLWVDNRRLLEIGVRLGKIVTTDDRDRPGVALQQAWPDHAHYVYHRQGFDCLRCGEKVQMGEMAQRKVYWCPGCQH